MFIHTSEGSIFNTDSIQVVDSFNRILVRSTNRKLLLSQQDMKIFKKMPDRLGISHKDSEFYELKLWLFWC
jgi:hypothetical protein